MLAVAQAVLCLAAAGETAVAADEPALKAVYERDFLLGAAVNAGHFSGQVPAKAGVAREREIVQRHFNSVTPENALKWGVLHARAQGYDFAEADRFVDYGRALGAAVIGHTLVWHSQMPVWVFSGADGQRLDRAALLLRMREHIHTVAGRYRGKIHGWDVVNEALEEDGSMRVSPWLQIIGEDYVVKAFEFAQEADPEAELYYNDYGLEEPRKREGALRLLRKLQAAGVKLSGVGLQGHYGLTYPPLGEIDKSLAAFAQLGLKVMVTELDVNVLPTPGNGGADVGTRFDAEARWNPYAQGLPPEQDAALAGRYAELFALFLKHREHLTRVTLWGVSDAGSWLNDFPIRGRTNYPLLFDREGRAKAAFHAVVKVHEVPAAEK